MVNISYKLQKKAGVPHRTISVKNKAIITLAGKYLYGTGKAYGRWEFTDNGIAERFFAFERAYLEAPHE